MKTRNTILGMAAGVAIGATLGVLFAPDKGKKTRKKIADKTLDAKGKLTQSFNDFLDTVSEKYNNLKEEGEQLIKKEKEALKNDIKSTVENV